VIWREVVIDREGEFIRHGLKPAGRFWWWPVLTLFVTFVWRYDMGGCARMSISTAWELSEGLEGIYRDPQKWQREQFISKDYHDACAAEVERARKEKAK